jgi:hypothetical protein
MLSCGSDLSASSPLPEPPDAPTTDPTYTTWLETESIPYNSGGYTGLIPTQYGLLTDLTSLGLASNELTGTIPSQLGLCSLATDFALQSNELWGSVPTGDSREDPTISDTPV